VPLLTFTAEVDDELAAAIKATGRSRFDLATIWGGNGDDPNAPVIADYIELDLVSIEGDDLTVTEIASDDEEARADAEDCICCPRCDVDDHRKDCPQWGLT
jgi:hypothetical protein